MTNDELPGPTAQAHDRALYEFEGENNLLNSGNSWETGMRVGFEEGWNAAMKQFEGFEREDTDETGQPNGVGDIESSDSREWFRDERVTHQRDVVTFTGPWYEWSPPQRVPYEETAAGLIEQRDKLQAKIDKLETK